MPNSYDVGGRVAMVTGGASGIGAAVSALLRRSGARVAVLDLAADPGPAAHGAGADLALPVDVTDSAAVSAAVVRVAAELGGPDILVCCAGISGRSAPTVEVGDDEWRRVFAVNTDGVFYANRAVLPGMVRRGYGRIVNLASIAGKEGNPQAAAYSASKAGVIALTKSIGKDVAGTGVLVNCVAPAVIETPMNEDVSPEHLRYMLERIPLGRIGQATEVAALVCWLASADASFSTGACFDASGGRAVY